MSDELIVGEITRTTPTSTPLDTLKALVLRNIDMLEHIIDRLAEGWDKNLSEEELDFLDAIKQLQYRALAEHVHVAKDERLGELRHIHPAGYQYDDGTPVVELFESRYGVSTYFTRYNGPRDEALARHHEWISQVEADVKFNEIVEGLDD